MAAKKKARPNPFASESAKPKLRTSWDEFLPHSFQAEPEQIDRLCAELRGGLSLRGAARRVRLAWPTLSRYLARGRAYSQAADLGEKVKGDEIYACIADAVAEALADYEAVLVSDLRGAQWRRGLAVLARRFAEEWREPRGDGVDDDHSFDPDERFL